MRIAIGSDHRGVQLKARLLQTFSSQGHEFLDAGADSRAQLSAFAESVSRVEIAPCGREVITRHGVAVVEEILDGSLCHQPRFDEPAMRRVEWLVE